MYNPGRGRRIAAFLCSFLGTLILLAVIIGCIPAVIPRFFDCQVYSVISGSMEPAIHVGSLVYVEPFRAQDIAEGDVIAFYGSDASGAIIVHRVVRNRLADGEFVTKGDANNTEDLYPVEYDRLQGKVTLIIPYMGQILYWISTSWGKLAAVSIIFFAAILHAIAAALRGTLQQREEP